jgi:CubicO group peptidase (beta-lactamase class C family)
LLKPATVELLQTSQRLKSGEETGYGLGWDLETVDVLGAPTRSIGHDGEVMGGPLVSLLTVPDHQITVAVMSNISYAHTSEMALKLAQIFAAQKKRPQ